MEAGKWTWLEVAKVASGLLTPILLSLGGIYIHRVTKRFEYSQCRSQKLIEKRLAVYDDIAPTFNDLFCYFTFVGGWRDVTPPSIVGLKRMLDKKIHVAAPLFGVEFLEACGQFQDLCFRTFNGPGKDATLRTHRDERRIAWIGEWKPDWDEYFAGDISEPEVIRRAYERVMRAFADDIGVNPSPAARRQ